MAPLSEACDTAHFRRALPVRCDRSEGCGPASLTCKPNHPSFRALRPFCYSPPDVHFPFRYDLADRRSQMRTAAFCPLTRLPVRPELSEATRGAVVRVCYRITVLIFLTPLICFGKIQGFWQPCFTEYLQSFSALHKAALSVSANLPSII